MNPHRQPLMHKLTATLQAPYQAWSQHDGNVMHDGVAGLYLGDTRLLCRAELHVGGEHGEALQVHSSNPTSDDTIGFQQHSFIGLARNCDAPSADPTLTVTRMRRVTVNGISETITIESALDETTTFDVRLTLASDLAAMEYIKAGEMPQPIAPLVEAHESGSAVITWARDDVAAVLKISAHANNSVRCGREGTIEISWQVTLPANGVSERTFSISGQDQKLPVAAPHGKPLRTPTVTHDDQRLSRLIDQSVSDLSALRLSTKSTQAHNFFAAGAPWFFTLFGRDSIIAARLALRLPDGIAMARDTLFTLAAYQGKTINDETAEQPGKILHEMRRDHLAVVEGGFELPPIYYGTIDATPLWINLLHAAVKGGLPKTDLQALAPHLVAALKWMRDYGDSDGDGFLEYIDKTGKGLANQGWKDSGDSVRHVDGTLAKGPIALCEVQGYAYAAAIQGAELLEALGHDGTEWQEWAQNLATRFREKFWVESSIGRFPAIALDADKQAVGSLTSNIGHIVATGMLSHEEIDDIANCLNHPSMNSGFGLRTLSSQNDGYWPLRYHAGSVWTHDTAYTILQLAHAGTPAAQATAKSLTNGLLNAAECFNYRMPELFAGYTRTECNQAVPYPASCVPQAWAAASAIALLEATEIMAR